MDAAGYVFTATAAIELNPHVENVVDFKANTLCKKKKNISLLLIRVHRFPIKAASQLHLY